MALKGSLIDFEQASSGPSALSGRADLRTLPIAERQRHLRSMLPKESVIVSESVAGKGRNSSL